MAYRKNSNYEHSWKTWLKRHQAYLTEDCGLPTAVVNDREEWFHLLDHGYSQGGYDIDELSPGQKARLRKFLKEHSGENFSGANLCLDRYLQP